MNVEEMSCRYRGDVRDYMGKGSCGRASVAWNGAIGWRLQAKPVIFSRAAKRGGVSNGGPSQSGLVLPFLSFFVLFGTFPIFLGFS